MASRLASCLSIRLISPSTYGCSLVGFEFQLERTGDVQNIERPATFGGCMLAAQLNRPFKRCAPEDVGLNIAAIGKALLERGDRIAPGFGGDLLTEGRRPDSVCDFGSTVMGHRQSQGMAPAPGIHRSRFELADVQLCERAGVYANAQVTAIVGRCELAV
jgi:hypothetical protein